MPLQGNKSQMHIVSTRSSKRLEKTLSRQKIDGVCKACKSAPETTPEQTFEQARDRD